MGDDIFSNRLLVVDDDPGIGRLIKRVAEGSGFDVVVREDPRVLGKTARSWHPAIIIMDLQMPGVDGIELLRDLAADRSSAQVILTSGVDGKVLESALQLGRERGLSMAGMLEKPIRLETLRELLGTVKPIAQSLLATDLAEAIAADQLFLEYQPKLDCRLGRISGVEALVRWRHPSLGIVRPDQFIALAEETDLIHRLTDWVVASAARQAAAWRHENLALGIAVNISAKDLENLDLPERLHRHCEQVGVDPALMTLELTESNAMREPVQMRDVLTRLRLKGFELSIDDFGTGYSSLVQLQRMPFSEIKIDRSFVAQMMDNTGCRVIVEIIIDLARKLGLTSVAEGVEGEAALESLTAMGCDIAQGYYLSRPLAADGLSEFVRKYHRIRAKSAA
jgi:EAL domain-containing protein (putative c-di-GMP-specific phosphodiesterase class I)